MLLRLVIIIFCVGLIFPIYSQNTDAPELHTVNDDLVIKEVKRNLILLLCIISLFVIGLISLIYYSKKIKIVNKQLDEYSKENEFLLKEANHRINNNLQLIIVLLNDELNKSEPSIEKTLTKIESISTLHRHLYQSKDKKTVNIKNYVNEIILNFNALFNDNNVIPKITITSISLPIDLAMYIGLLITELFTNSLKYAFKNQNEKIVCLHIYNTKSNLHINYRDNGQDSIGKQIKPLLVSKICKQIKASHNIETQLGFEIYITKNLTINNEKPT